MKLYGTENNILIMKELGQRIKDIRIDMKLTQQEFAEKAGISLKTLARTEQGENIALDKFCNILRVCGELGNIDLIIPERKVNPVELIDNIKRKQRVKKSAKAATKKDAQPFIWGDEK